MASIKQNIKTLREHAGLSQEELGDKIGKTRSAISQYESGKIIPRMGVIEDLATVFGVKKSRLIGDSSIYENMLGIAPESEFFYVPVVGSVAAGTPIEMIEIEDTFPLAMEKHNEYPDAFFLRVKGESMNRILPNGVLALIDPCETVDYDNDPYAVCVNGHEATVKRVHKLNNGFELVPDSTDPTYKPQVFDYGVEGTETITPIGRVVYHVIPFDWRY